MRTGIALIMGFTAATAFLAASAQTTKPSASAPASSPATAASQSAGYKIVLSSKSVVGEKYYLSEKSKSRGQKIILSPGKKALQEEFGHEFEGTIQVLKVNEKGKTTEKSVIVDKCIFIKDDKKTDVLPKGTEVVASWIDGKKVFRLKDDSTKLSEDATKVLQQIITLSPDSPTDDEAFGTSKLVMAGESWPLNREILAKRFSADMRLEQQLKPDDIKGQVKFHGVIIRDGFVLLDIGIEIEISNFKLSAPNNAEFKNSSVNSSMRGVKSADTAQRPPTESSNSGKMESSFITTSPDGTKIEGTISYETKTETSIKPLN
ncbi:MAG: hypothetical protein HZA50_10740 [Planctomycetes bacterium]|nr:hypothetical protein [Planctomycetota bacterium]